MGAQTMDLVLTEPRIRLTCLSNADAIETLDIDQLVDDLADGTPPDFLTPERLCVQDLVVVATAEAAGRKATLGSGRYVGLLGARDAVVEGHPFVHLDMACVAPRARGQRLVSRLIAQAAAERVGQTAILAARTATPSWFRALRHFASALSGAAFHPAPAGTVVKLRTAALARQIAGELCPEHRHDVATGVLHGNWAVPTRPVRRYASADAWCAAIEAESVISERLLAVIDLHDVTAGALRELSQKVG